MATRTREDVRNGRKATLTSSSTSNESGLVETVQRFWRKSYAGDYLGLILLATLEVLLKLLAEPFHQLFLLSDVRLQHPHAAIETVSVHWLFVYAGALPLVVCILWTLVWKRDTHKAHVTALGLVTSILLTSFITDVLKDAIGRPRPDLLDRCSPAASTPTNVLVGVDVCTETRHHLLHDGWRSFPSGHSSFSFAGLGWLSLFFASQTHLLHTHSSLLNVLLCLVPLLGAAMIAISRLEDYRHDVFDVTCGSLLGLLVTYLTWRRFYPSLADSECEEPYCAPTGSGSGSGSHGNGFRRLRDEEELYAVGEEGSSGYGERDGNR